MLTSLLINVITYLLTYLDYTVRRMRFKARQQFYSSLSVGQTKYRMHWIYWNTAASIIEDHVDIIVHPTAWQQSDCGS